MCTFINYIYLLTIELNFHCISDIHKHVSCDNFYNFDGSVVIIGRGGLKHWPIFSIICSADKAVVLLLCCPTAGISLHGGMTLEVIINLSFMPLLPIQWATGPRGIFFSFYPSVHTCVPVEVFSNWLAITSVIVYCISVAILCCFFVCRIDSNGCDPWKWRVADDNRKPSEVAEDDASASPGSGIHNSGTSWWHYVECTEGQ